MKFQGKKSIRSKNIDVLVKVGKSNTYPIYFENIESFIKWAVLMLITPNLVSTHKMVILFECVQKNRKSTVPISLLLFSFVFKQ